MSIKRDYSKREHRKEAICKGIDVKEIEHKFVEQSGMHLEMSMPSAEQMRKGFRF